MHAMQNVNYIHVFLNMGKCFFSVSNLEKNDIHICFLKKEDDLTDGTF